MNFEPTVDDIISVIKGADAQRNIDEIISVRQDEPTLLSNFNHGPQKLSSRLREYVDGEGTVFILDDEDREMNFVAYGFICEVVLPLNLPELSKRERFKPGSIRQQISIIGGGSELFAKFVLAQRAIYSFMASTTGREPFRSFVPEYFAGLDCLSPCTRLFTKQNLANDVIPQDIPQSLDYTGRVRDVCRRKGYLFSEDNSVDYWRLIPATATSGFEVTDVPVTYFAIGQLVELKMSFRAHKIGNSYSFRTKLNSVVVYNDDATREIEELSHNHERAHREVERIKIGVPRKRAAEYKITTRLDHVRFLKGVTEETMSCPPETFNSEDSDAY